MNVDKFLEYGWVFAIVFFLVLFLGQTLVIWLLGPVGSVFAWIMMILVSLAVTYLLLFGGFTHIGERMREKVEEYANNKPLHQEQIELDDIPEVEQLNSKPADAPEVEYKSALIEELESYAHDNGALISGEAVRLVARHQNRAKVILANIVEEAKKTYPKFDGWVVLNKAQITELEAKAMNLAPEPKPQTLEVVEKVIREEEKQDKKEGEKEQAEPTEKEHDNTWKDKLKSYHDRVEEEKQEKNVPVPSNLPTGDLQSKETFATATLIEMLCNGDEDAIFTFIRRMRQGEGSGVREFIRETVLTLDAIHEHRVDGVGYVEKDVLEHTRCFSNDELEELIAILIGSVDYRYKLPDLAVKLSLVRAVEYIKKARAN